VGVAALSGSSAAALLATANSSRLLQGHPLLLQVSTYIHHKIDANKIALRIGSTMQLKINAFVMITRGKFVAVGIGDIVRVITGVISGVAVTEIVRAGQAVPLEQSNGLRSAFPFVRNSQDSVITVDSAVFANGVLSKIQPTNVTPPGAVPRLFVTKSILLETNTQSSNVHASQWSIRPG
jgi:hypothetical protein